MSSSKLRYDQCSYEEKLRRSVGPGMYMLTTPADDKGESCKQDIPADPYLRYQSWGPNSCPPGSAVDDGSELLGINYKSSKCDKDAYTPGKYNSRGACAPAGTAPARKPNCSTPQENTRLSNPPCTLRATGWNRWEWLCWDPQDKALIPFEWNTSYRTVVKDNHTPIIEEPLDQSIFMPNGMSDGRNFNSSGSTWKACAASAPGNPFAVYSVHDSTIQTL